MLAIVDWTVVVSTIPLTLTALAGLIAAIRAGNQAKATRVECTQAHAETNAQVAAVGEQVVSAAQDAATTAAEVRAALVDPASEAGSWSQPSVPPSPAGT